MAPRRVRGKALAWRWTVVLILVVAGLSACGEDEKASQEPARSAVTDTSATTAATPMDDDLPGPVAATRFAILEAAEAKDYDKLASLVRPDRFLSDFGFGIDPVGRWRESGTEPLKVMATLLTMRHAPARKTNEGTLYEWPRFTTDSEPGEMTPAEREALLTILDKAELEAAFLSDTGYTGPRLGILANGVWWFFIQESGP